MSHINTKKLITSAIIGALYAVLTVLLAPISYGPLQLRVSEALCVLPYFAPYTAWGLFFGCAAANLLSAAGILDVIFGSLATLISCLCIAVCGSCGKGSLKSRMIACLMPAVFNGVTVGAMLTTAIAGLSITENWGAFLIYAGQIALGELAVMFFIGLPLMSYVAKRKFFAELS